MSPDNRTGRPTRKEGGPDVRYEDRNHGATSSPRQWRRRREASWRLPPRPCGCVDPSTCRCTEEPSLSDCQLDGWRDAALHLLATDLLPSVPAEVQRALWRRGGADRDLAKQLHERVA